VRDGGDAGLLRWPPPVQLMSGALPGRRGARVREGRGYLQRAKAASGVKITTLPVPYDALADKITAAVPRGKGPDIFIFAQDRLGGWVEAGKTIEPIDFYVDKATKDRFLPSTV
jgi:maltose-binding protein MalE